MFGSKRQNAKKAIHEIPFDEWENILDKIYYKVIGRHASALAIVSNTKRETSEDNVGVTSEQVTYRFKKDSSYLDN